MEKNTYPKIKDKIESMEKDSPSTFPRIFSTIAKSETKLGAWIYSNTRRTFLARPSNEISYRGWLISGLRTTFWHWVHARTHTQGIRRKIVPLSRTDYQEFPGTINLLAATPQAPFPPPPPLLFFRQPHSPSLPPGKATRERPIQPIVRDGEPGCCTDQKPLSRPEAAAILLCKRG